MATRWQTLTAALLGVGGVILTAIIAVRNVAKQIKINVFSEEDRIERLLPGLREADHFAGSFLQYRVTRGFHGIVQCFQDDGFGVVGSTYLKDVAKALPNTDQSTRRMVEQRLYTCFNWARNAEAMRLAIEAGVHNTSDPSQWDTAEYRKVREEIDEHRAKFAQYREQYGIAMDALEAEILLIRKKTELYEDRLGGIREELETYFAHHRNSSGR
jgi:hypothetical protein